uniref:MFS domain-containing protein n=1 Tax=Panagrellus redivivus TaxID=6233 RepID=A0A7E4ZVB1_PANRE
MFRQKVTPIPFTEVLTQDDRIQTVTNLPSLDLSSDDESKRSVKLKFDQQSTDWASIYVATSVTFVGAVQFSLYFSSLWPYLQVIDPSATETFFGAIIASYSLGQMLASPLVGYWSNKIKTSIPPLYMGLCLMFIGNCIYFFAPIIPIPVSKKYLILVSRFLTGSGSANISLLRAYASTASTGKDRSKAIALVTGGLALGMTMGPGFQLLFTPLGPKGLQVAKNILINIYTAPALAGCAMNMLGIFLIKKYFIEKHIGIPDSADKEKHGELPPYDKFALLICYITRFCQMFIVCNLESIGTPLAMTMFAWDRPTVVRNVSVSQVLQALVAFAVYSSYVKFNLGRVLNSKNVLYVSITGLIVFHLVTYSWPFLPGKMVTYNNLDVAASNGTELVGCNVDYFDWCDDIPPVNYIVFYTAYVLIIGISFPYINIALNTLFSKIIGPRRQAAQQGWLQVSGAAARFVGPVIISFLYTEFGPRWSWNVSIAVVVATLSLWVIFRERMVPLVVPEAFAHFQDQDDPDVKQPAKKKLNDV